ncbi:hypothetical protein [Cognaticolwellia beringensis]|nr:hypothetical protein [Cognaticolwellia beringensis]
MSADKELSELLSEYPRILAEVRELFKEPEAAISWLKKPIKNHK